MTIDITLFYFTSKPLCMENLVCKMQFNMQYVVADLAQIKFDKCLFFLGTWSAWGRCSSTFEFPRILATHKCAISGSFPTFPESTPCFSDECRSADSAILRPINLFPGAETTRDNQLVIVIGHRNWCIIPNHTIRVFIGVVGFRIMAPRFVSICIKI